MDHEKVSISSRLLEMLSDILESKFPTGAFLLLLFGMSLIKKFDSFFYAITKFFQSVGRKDYTAIKETKNQEGKKKWKSSSGLQGLSKGGGKYGKQ